MNLVAIWQSLHRLLQTLGNVHWSTGSGVDDSECNGQFLTVIAQTEHLSLQTLCHAATISYLVHNPKLIHQDRQYLQLCMDFNQLRMFFIICYKFILPIVLMNALPFFKCLPLTLSQSSQHLVLLPLHIENENASCCCPESTCLKIMALQTTTFAPGHPVEQSPSSLNTPATCMHVTEMMTHKSIKTCSLFE